MRGSSSRCCSSERRSRRTSHRTWEYQLKFDGYRAIAFKTAGNLHLRSRINNDLSVRFATIVRGLAKLPNETVIDGELFALAEDGRPSFNALQN